MRKHIPNLLTVGRLFLAGALFAVLSRFRFDFDLEGPQQVLLGLAVGLFVVAAATDALDGYLARRWQVESKFGRILDPVCDKLLILGSLVYLASGRFSVLQAPPDAGLVRQVSGVYPWMVAVILLRELLVTSIRAGLEGSGIRFGANLWGKLKMILQSLVVPVVLVLLWFLEPGRRNWADALRDGLVWATVLATVASGVPYVWRARAALRESSATAQ